MKRMQKEKGSYITKEERKKCRKVMDAFAKLYQGEDIVVLDAGNYGFVKLQYYKSPFGFSSVFSYTDSDELFTDLWIEWRNTQLLTLSGDTPMADLEYRQIFQCLPPKAQKQIMREKIYFLKKAGKKGIRKGRLWNRNESGVRIGSILTGRLYDGIFQKRKNAKNKE